MKKLFGLLCLGMTMLGLSSCDDEQKIQYVDETGKVQEIVVQETDNREVVEGVFQFIEQAKYEDIDSFSTTLEMNCSMTSVSKLKSSYDVKAQLSLNVEQGIFGAVNLNVMNSNSMNIELLYNGSLKADLPQGNVYISMKDGKTEEKFKISVAEAFEAIWDQIEDEIGDFIPELPDVDQTPSFTLDDFYEKFSASTIRISKVTSQAIQVRVGIVLDDILKQAIPQEEYNQIKQMLNLDFLQELVFFITVDAKTGFLQEFNFTFSDVDLINCLLLFANPNSTETNLSGALKDFKLEIKWSFSYKDVVIKQLTDAEKDTYIEMPQIVA